MKKLKWNADRLTSKRNPRRNAHHLFWCENSSTDSNGSIALLRLLVRRRSLVRVNRRRQYRFAAAAHGAEVTGASGSGESVLEREWIRERVYQRECVSGSVCMAPRHVFSPSLSVEGRLGWK